MKTVALSSVKDDLSKYLRLAAKEEIVITRHGKTAGVLIGFDSDDDWFDYRLENDLRFMARVASARTSVRAGRGVPLEGVKSPGTARTRATASPRSPARRPKARTRSRVHAVTR